MVVRLLLKLVHNRTKAHRLFVSKNCLQTMDILLERQHKVFWESTALKEIEEIDVDVISPVPHNNDAAIWPERNQDDAISGTCQSMYLCLLTNRVDRTIERVCVKESLI